MDYREAVPDREDDDRDDAGEEWNGGTRPTLKPCMDCKRWLLLADDAARCEPCVDEMISRRSLRDLDEWLRAEIAGTLPPGHAGGMARVRAQLERLREEQR